MRLSCLRREERSFSVWRRVLRIAIVFFWQGVCLKERTVPLFCTKTLVDHMMKLFSFDMKKLEKELPSCLLLFLIAEAMIQTTFLPPSLPSQPTMLLDVDKCCWAVQLSKMRPHSPKAEIEKNLYYISSFHNKSRCKCIALLGDSCTMKNNCSNYLCLFVRCGSHCYNHAGQERLTGSENQSVQEKIHWPTTKLKYGLSVAKLHWLLLFAAFHRNKTQWSSSFSSLMGWAVIREFVKVFNDPVAENVSLVFFWESLHIYNTDHTDVSWKS